MLELTEGAGATHVVETGGPGTLGKSMQAVAYGGHIALIGVLAGLQGDTNPHPIMRKGASLHGIFVGNRAMFERMNTAIEVNGLQPVVDRVFEFEEAADAYRYQQSAVTVRQGRNTGLATRSRARCSSSITPNPAPIR